MSNIICAAGAIIRLIIRHRAAESYFGWGGATEPHCRSNRVLAWLPLCEACHGDSLASVSDIAAHATCEVISETHLTDSCEKLKKRNRGSCSQASECKACSRVRLADRRNGAASSLRGPGFILRSPDIVDRLSVAADTLSRSAFRVAAKTL